MDFSLTRCNNDPKYFYECVSKFLLKSQVDYGFVVWAVALFDYNKKLKDFDCKCELIRMWTQSPCTLNKKLLLVYT